MVRGEHVDHIIVSVEAVNFVAGGVFNELTRPVVQLENAGEQSIVREERAPSLESSECHVVQGAHRPIPDECLYYFWKLLYQVRCAYTAYGSTVDSNLAANLQAVN